MGGEDGGGHEQDRDGADEGGDVGGEQAQHDARHPHPVPRHLHPARGLGAGRRRERVHLGEDASVSIRILNPELSD